MRARSGRCDDDRLVLNFRGIPEGVTVTASLMGTGEAMEDDGTDLAPLMLKTGADDLGTHVEDGVGSLSALMRTETSLSSAARTGQIVYTFDDEDGTD